MTADREQVQLVTESGEPCGTAFRIEAHRNPRLLHRVVHVLVFDRRGRLLLQRRSKAKDLGPGLWDVSVGGHVIPGEGDDDAARRETREELGIDAPDLQVLYRYIFRGLHESEYVVSFRMIHEGPFGPDPAEIDMLRFEALDRIRRDLGRGRYTENFETELRRFLEPHRDPATP